MEERENLSFGEVPERYCSEDNLDDFFRSFKHFGLRARQELTRAERYCEYLSCLTITMTSSGRISEAAEILNYHNQQEMLEGLRRVIKRSIRQTDVASGFDENRIALLLVETPRNGAKALSNRLQENIQNFLLSNVASEEDWKVSFTIVSFPDNVNTKEDFLGQLDGLASGPEAQPL